mgnify:CR=1 FL=1
MNEFFSTPAFGVTLTATAFWLGKMFQKHTRFHSLPPIIPACVIIICILQALGVDYQTYSRGSEFIAFMLGPATIAFSLPLIYNATVLKENLKPLIVGNICGGIAGVLAVLALAKALNISQALAVSMVPKSVTAPIAMGISETIGGIPSITVVMVIFTGIFGAFVGHKILKACGVTHHIAIGIAMGAAAHAIGANRCLKESELQTAVASISIIIVAIVTAICAPLLVHFVW